MSGEVWYHGRMTRQRAEELVSKAGIDGSFVVRASESIQGAYALCVLYNGSIHTYRVLPTESGLLAVQTINGVQQRKFTSITELITAYRNPQNGLICALTNPVGPGTEQQVLSPPPPVATAIPSRSGESRISQIDVPRPVLPPPNFPAPGPPRAGPRISPEDFKTQRELPPLPHPSRDRSPTCQASQKPPVPLSRGASNPTIPSPNRRESAGISPVAPPQLPMGTVKTILASPSASKALSPPTGSKSSFSHEIIDCLQERVKLISSTCSAAGKGYLEQLNQYCYEGAKHDVDDVLNGSRQCVEMQKLLAKEAGQFEEELELFLTKIEVLRQLFDLQSTIVPISLSPHADRDVDLDSFLTRLGDCKDAVKNLDKRIKITIKERAGMEVESMYGTALRSSSGRSCHSIPEYDFEVKTDGPLKFTRAKLQVNIDLGRLVVMKGDDIAQFKHDQVLQIVKSNKSRGKLSILFDTGKKRDFAFDSSSQREAFCQVMQLLRNMHSGNTEPDSVSVFIGTWNMGDAMPPVDIRSWFRCGGTGRSLDPSVCNIPHDIYVIGTQETGLPEKEWLQKVTETIIEITGQRYHLVAMDALWHIKIIILVKEDHKNRISHVQTSSVKTGIANTLGNKGAVAVGFQFGGTSLCFINAHLTSGNEKCSRRNQNYHDIMKALNLGLDRFSVFDLTNRFDHLFFIGDLNYRLDMDIQGILSLIKKQDYCDLYKVDQLRREKEFNKVFYRFEEEEILFPPTYRYERGNRENYAHLKIKRTGIRINVPSWCDRVLWKSYPETHNVCHAYGCTDDIMTSDHSPVFCNMHIGVRGQYASSSGFNARGDSMQGGAMIHFDKIEAILKAPGKTNFYLQFHSSCLSSSVRTPPNIKYDTTEMGPNMIRIVWDNIPKLEPIISEREFLVDQHLLVLVKSDEDNDSHAEFVLALRSMIGTSPQRFQEHLTRKGEDAGQIQGSMLVKTRDNVKNRKEKTYDFIQFGKREEIESVTYSDPNEISSENKNTPKPSLLTNMASKITGAALKLSFPKKDTKMTQPQRSDSESRPPMAPPSNVIQPAVYTESLQRSTPSGLSSPSINTQSTPMFPSRSRGQARMSSGSVTFDMPPVVSPSSTLDAAIAEFEAAGNMFESMSTDSASKYDTPTKQPSSQEYETVEYPEARKSVQPRPQPRNVGVTQMRKQKTPSPQFRRRSVRVSGALVPISSVDDLLSRIGLPQYTDALLSSGWDTVEFLSDMLKEDLIECGVTNEDHQQLILSTVDSLGWMD